jgi:cobyrinic acid a,c-diamide synthase
MSRFMVAAPSSGAGKTTITLALMRLMQRAQIEFQPAKSGPDYIDPGFHSAAAGTPSVNLDAWAMPADVIRTLAGSGGLVVEAAMGLFDGAGRTGKGSAADLAHVLDIPVILVVDAAKTAHSIAALVTGFRDFDPRVTVAGVVLNRVGTARHLEMLTQALRAQDIYIFGHLTRSESFALPERHLGLVQAGEIDQLEHWIDHIAGALQPSLDLAALSKLTGAACTSHAPLPKPPAQHIAIASDRAFAFCYPHQLKAWRDAGATLSLFSPLADEPAPKAAQYIFLPGGYPELHAGKLASAAQFKASLEHHAAIGTPIYGECGGYMVLGNGLIDANGQRHEMLGLLPLETSFQHRKLHLGYRQLTPLSAHFNHPLMAHEFHYARTLKAAGPALFAAKDADHTDLGEMGLHIGHTCGSFAHIISGH